MGNSLLSHGTALTVGKHCPVQLPCPNTSGQMRLRGRWAETCLPRVSKLKDLCGPYFTRQCVPIAQDLRVCRICFICSFSSFVHCAVYNNRPSTQIAVRSPWVWRRALWQLVRCEELASDLSTEHCLCRKRQINSFLAAYDLVESYRIILNPW